MYEQAIESVFESAIGPNGLNEADFHAEMDLAARALERLRGSDRADERAIFQLLGHHEDLDLVAGHVARIGERASDVVIFGIGGSSLGGQAATALVKKTDKPRLHFPENPDPDSLDHLFATLPLTSTHFFVISKSGGTPEPLAEFFAALAAVQAAGGDVSASFTVITEPATPDNPEGNVLRRLAKKYGMTAFEHDPNLGGRFSVLSIVGMIPAIFAGLDPRAFRKGAAEVLARALSAGGPEDCPPAIGAAISAGLEKKNGMRVAVMFPYSDALDKLAMWYRQLWAESLGKEGKGTVPVRAVGPVDQHSQVQLYLDGPADKLFTVLIPDWRGKGPKIDPALADDPSLVYLAGRTVGDLVDAEARATAATLAKKGRPVRIFRIPALNEQTLGALFMHFMLETIITADLLGVDPFGQPAVEAGKKLARSYLMEGKE